MIGTLETYNFPDEPMFQMSLNVIEIEYGANINIYIYIIDNDKKTGKSR